MRVLLRLGVAGALLGGTVLLAGCDVAFNYLEDGLIRDDRVTEVHISGGSGDLTVVRDDAVKGVDIRRKARYRQVAPRDTMRVEGGVVQLASDCGPNCSASYEVRVPYGERGVKVTGDVGSGNVRLTSVSDVDIQLGSGDIDIKGASGTVTVDTRSGNITLSDIAGDLRASAMSGDIDGRGLRGARNTVTTESGNITLAVPGTGDLTAEASSGDITVSVPDDTVVVSADTDSGDRTITVTQSTAANAKRLTLRTDAGNIVVKRGL